MSSVRACEMAISFQLAGHLLNHALGRTILLMHLTAVFTPAPEGGYTAMIEEVPGAISEGETIAEARENLADALRMVLECNREIARLDATSTAVRESIELSAL
jgi:predicted RNase H-like HicB family nuclease